MKHLLTGVIILLAGNCMAQSAAVGVMPKVEQQKQSTTIEVPNNSIADKLKKDAHAPERNRFTQEADYLKAKEEWVNKNKQTYEAIISIKNKTN